MENNGWWTNESLANYNERASCVERHYSSIIVKELPNRPHIDGMHTLNDNIADIIGNRLGYYAYRM